MRSRFRGSANVGPYTTIVGLLREYGEVESSFLTAQLVELRPETLDRHLRRLERAGAIEREGDTVRLVDSEHRANRERLVRA